MNLAMESIENMEKLLKAIRDIAYGVHVYLGCGYLEKVYENCLKHRREKAGYKVEAQKNLKVHDDDGYELGDYYVDLIVNDSLILELKAVKSIAPEHLAQTMNYLKTTGYSLGLVINFGSYQFETRKVYPPTKNSHREHVERVESFGGLGTTPSSNTSPCYPRSPRPTENSHREHVERVEDSCAPRIAPASQLTSLGGYAGTQNSPCSPWLKTPTPKGSRA